MYVRVSHPLVTAIAATQRRRAFRADFHGGVRLGDINASVQLEGLHTVLAPWDQVSMRLGQCVSEIIGMFSIGDRNVHFAGKSDELARP